METYYHFTSYNNLNNIIREGLVPQRGFRCQTIDDDRSGVFLSKGISNSIAMYALMLGYYLKWSGPEGDALISEYTNNIQMLSQTNSFGLDKFRNDLFIKQYREVIERIMQVKRCGNFINYLGGYGCYLSINGLDGIDCSNGNDCCYNGIIPPEYIKVVRIKNMFNGISSDLLDYVLSYFIYCTPLEEVLKSVGDNNEDVNRLYRDRDVSWCSDWALEELPIINYHDQYIKTLTIN